MTTADSYGPTVGVVASAGAPGSGSTAAPKRGHENVRPPNRPVRPPPDQEQTTLHLEREALWDHFATAALPTLQELIFEGGMGPLGNKNNHRSAEEVFFPGGLPGLQAVMEDRQQWIDGRGDLFHTGLFRGGCRSVSCVVVKAMFM